METGERIRVEDFETRDGQPDPKGIVDRWLAELDLAGKSEREWREESRGIWSRYKTEKQKSSGLDESEASFNILWSNTEIIVPSLYNSTPSPDVRRRFKDRDPLGKAVATILERSLIYSIDAYDFDAEIELAVLDFALTGRGITRIRYLPEIHSEEEAKPEDAPEDYEPKTIDKITGQDTVCEHWSWDKFRHGPGKKWGQVPWVAFEHDMSYDDLVEYFGEEMADKVPLSSGAESESMGDEVKKLFQSGSVWEIWDKLKRRVLFIAKGVDEPLLSDDSPTLQFKDFFPMPRPAQAILDSTSLVPVPLYRQYKAQAEEINRLTKRIEKVTDMIRVRGAYISHIKAASQLMDAGDGVMIPIEDIGALVGSNIDLDKLIWIFPVEKLNAVLEALYRARDQVKQTIYEIIGLSDIMRGATKATETLGAQQLKSQWGSIRLQRMQKEVQRFVRDILRLKAEVIAEHYEPEVLATMTQVKLPMGQEKQQLQMAVQTARSQGQQVPEDVMKLLESPSWDEAIAVMRQDSARQYRISVETDSTILNTADRDAKSMQANVESIGAVFGAIPLLRDAGAQNAAEVAKELALSILRHSRFGGRAVEDVVDDIEFGPGVNEMQQALDQIGQAVQQGGQQIAQMGEKLGQHEQVLGQVIKTLQAQAATQPQAAA